VCSRLWGSRTWPAGLNWALGGSLVFVDEGAEDGRAAVGAGAGRRGRSRHDQALLGALLRCAFPNSLEARLWDAPVSSGGEHHVVECQAEPVQAGGFGSDVVVAAPEVLHEGMTGGQNPR
jgi:hypothetical protein